MVDLRQVVEPRRAAVDWIRDATPIDAVFACTPLEGHLTVAGLCGRKCVAVPIGHLNPAVEGARLLEDLEEMLDTEDERSFLTLAGRHRVSYVLVHAGSAQGARRLTRYLGWRSLRPVFEDPGQGTLIFELRGGQIEPGLS
jgi:hypothetical protein